MEMSTKARVCANCGTDVSENQRNRPQAGERIVVTTDNGGCGWTMLSCCIPFLGLILFIVWNKERPNTAMSCLIGAIIGLLFFGGGLIRIL
jgi:thiol:disulfide interchange protein